MDWVSFEEIKNTVTLQMALDRYGIMLRRVNAHSLRGRCPLPMHHSENSTESFTATLNKGTGGAWACQSQSCVKARGRVGGNVLDFVAAMEQCSVRDAAIKLQTWFLVPAAGSGGKVNESNRKGGEKDSAIKEPKIETSIATEMGAAVLGSETNKPLTFTLQNIDYRHPYLGGRELSDEMMDEFGIGYFSGKGSMHGRIVIPVHNATGDLVAYAGRVIDDSEPRYKFPPGFHKSLELFNLHRVKAEASVVLVEGFFGCMKLVQEGFPCVALMGSTMSAAQEKLLAEYFGHVVVMLDGDEAGRRAAEEIVERLRRVIFQVHAVDLPDGVQPDHLSSEKVYELLHPIL